MDLADIEEAALTDGAPACPRGALPEPPTMLPLYPPKTNNELLNTSATNEDRPLGGSSVLMANLDGAPQSKRHEAKRKTDAMRAGEPKGGTMPSEREATRCIEEAALRLKSKRSWGDANGA